MKKTKIVSKLTLGIFLLVNVLNNFSIVYAITETDVENMVNESSKAAVTGNLFIWFICAFAFLKVSQKVDSYMASLGLNVGHTGGSLLSDLVATGRGLAMANGVFSGQGFTDGSMQGGFGKQKTNSDTNFLQGGLAGAVGRKFDNTAKTLASNKGSSSLASPIFNNSMKNSGTLATNGISQIAKGDIKKDGMITGEKASKAFNSYFSNSLNSNSSNLSSSSTSNLANDSNIMSNSAMDSNMTTALNNNNQFSNQNDVDTNGMQTITSNINSNQGFNNTQSINPSENIVTTQSNSAFNNQLNNENNNISPINNSNGTINRVENISSTPTESSVQTSDGQIIPAQNGSIGTMGSNGDITSTQIQPNQTMSNSIDSGGNMSPQTTENISIPTYTNIEIGGGHIFGTETSEDHSQGINFAMYNTEQYAKPNGDYTTVTSNDNSTWYKQYETKAEVKTPHEKPDGQIGYTSKLVNKLPEPPKRKDRL